MRPVHVALTFLASALIGGVLAFNALAQPSSDRLKQLVRDASSPPDKENTTMTTTAGTTPAVKRLSRSGFDITPLSESAVDELAKKLKPEEARVIRAKGTEAPFCGTLLDNKKEGTYACRLCSLPLFSSEHKFNSGTGWPSFFQPYDMDHVAYVKDGGLGMERIEILCTRCDAHLGHVFEDGPRPTGLRYCLNSISMEFVEKGTPLALAPVAMSTAYFAAGCFWGVEDRFQQTPGVINAVSGYMGGKVSEPTYKQVCYTDTGHAETVMVTFDPTVITYTQLLEKFFKYHDPTTLNRQGPDIGSQYRSAIFASTPEHLTEAKNFIAELSKKPKFQKRPIVTQVTTAEVAGKFWSAEEVHQDYHERNGGHCALPPADDE